MKIIIICILALAVFTVGFGPYEDKENTIEEVFKIYEDMSVLDKEIEIIKNSKSYTEKQKKELIRTLICEEKESTEITKRLEIKYGIYKK